MGSLMLEVSSYWKHFVIPEPVSVMAKESTVHIVNLTITIIMSVYNGVTKINNLGENWL